MTVRRIRHVAGAMMVATPASGLVLTVERMVVVMRRRTTSRLCVLRTEASRQSIGGISRPVHVSSNTHVLLLKGTLHSKLTLGLTYT